MSIETYFGGVSRAVQRLKLDLWTSDGKLRP